MDTHQGDKIVLKVMYGDENNEKPELIELTSLASSCLSTYITESNKVTIQIYGTRYVAKVEHYKSGEILQITNVHGEFVLSTGNENWDKAYVTGKYDILVEDYLYDENFKYTIEVKPVGVTTLFRNKMIRVIDGFLHNVHLHRDNVRRAENYIVEKVEAKDNRHVRINLMQLSNNLQNTIVSDYEFSHVMKKQNARTIRKMLQKEHGIASMKYVNAQKKVSMDVPINRALKYILIRLLDDKGIEQECRLLLDKLEDVIADDKNLGILKRLPYYREVYNWYLLIQSNISERLIQSCYLPSTRKTPDIFELYVLVQILKFYQQIGYQFEQSSIEIERQLINKDYGLIVLSKEHESISLDFNYNLIKNPENHHADHMISINTLATNAKNGKKGRSRGPLQDHGRPDFLIKKYVDGKIVSIQIVEAKCRNSKNIMENNILNPKIEKQCRAYLTLGYVDIQQELHIGLVKKVVLIHPSKSDAEQKCSFFYNRIITHSITESSSIGAVLY